jgi:hypothetical protein
MAYLLYRQGEYNQALNHYTDVRIISTHFQFFKKVLQRYVLALEKSHGNVEDVFMADCTRTIQSIIEVCKTQNLEEVRYLPL